MNDLVICLAYVVLLLGNVLLPCYTNHRRHIKRIKDI